MLFFLQLMQNFSYKKMFSIVNFSKKTFFFFTLELNAKLMMLIMTMEILVSCEHIFKREAFMNAASTDIK